MFDVEKWEQVLVEQYGLEAQSLVDAAAEYAARNPGVLDFHKNLCLYMQEVQRIPAELRALHADPMARSLLFELITNSKFGFDIIMRNRRLFWQIIQGREFLQIWGRGELYKDCKNQLSLFYHYNPRIDALVEFHQYHTLRLLLGDIGEHIELESVTAELSDLTDVVTECAIELAKEKVSLRYGKPQTGFVVFGMGKLGGRELNYSSDIDLIFVYGSNGSTITTSDEQKEIDHHGYYKRVGTEVIRILDEHHKNGRLYRVDMRLRPEGDSGELVLNYAETVNYYYTVGRHWERQAMIKVRPIAGDLKLGKAFVKELIPWIYSTHVSYDHIGQARSMRRRIEERAEKLDLKAGFGGIRDIEFLVQHLQLLYGGRYKDLRNQTTIESLRLLMQHGLLPSEEVQELIEYYSWLRMAEHRLQMLESRQLHEVPTEEVALQSLAHRCGFEGIDASEDFLAHMHSVRKNVREIADRHYLLGHEDKDALIALILDVDPPQELIDKVLSPIGFENNARAAKLIRSLSKEPFFILSRARTESVLIDILPPILVLLQSSPEPDQTLRNFTRIVSAVGGRYYFYLNLQSDPELLITIMTFAGWANFLIDYLMRFPGLIDDLFENMDPEDLFLPDVKQEANDLIHGLANPHQSLAYIHARELVRIAIHDLRGFEYLSVCRALSQLACDILSVAFDFCSQRLAEAWGWPEEDGKRVECAVLGLGKLGSGELSYASDIDVIYVSQPGGVCTEKDRDGNAFWTRVVKDVSSFLENIYEVDPRLRPWGEQGQLVITEAALTTYWSQKRELWERLAMTRVTYVCGCDQLGKSAVDNILSAALEAPLPENAAAEIMTMRKRMEDSVKRRDHLKRGPGGYVDIEFIAQYLSIKCLKGDLPIGLSIRECLDYLSEKRCISIQACSDLKEALRLMRSIESRMRLSAGKAISSIPTKDADRLALARRCGYEGIEILNDRCEWARGIARPLFEALIN